MQTRKCSLQQNSSAVVVAISIQTVNGDVAILALYYVSMLSKPLYIKIVARKNERILNLIDVASKKIFLEPYLTCMPSRDVIQRVHFTKLAKDSG